VEDSVSVTWDYTVPGVATAHVVDSAVGSWIPLVDGSEPPVLVSDGAGVLILVPYEE